MTIPAVEERQVRDCLKCEFYHDNDGRYYCSINKGGRNRPENIYFQRMEFFDSDSQHILNVWPCVYNFTPEELTELIDSGAV